jgi:hypothetical protein
MNVIEESISEQALIEVFRERHPYWRERLPALSEHFASKSGYGVFAPIKGNSCGACRMTVATARLQRAKSGLFITCATCARFLYLASMVLSESSPAPKNHS